MRVGVAIKLKPAILDPQGKAVLRSLQQLGYNEVKDVRIGKIINLEVEGEDMEQIASRTEEMSKKLLANPLMEDFAIHFYDENGDD